MAWEISHTQEAWDNVRHNLLHWSKEDLAEALADDLFEKLGMELEHEQASLDYQKLLLSASQEELVQVALEKIEENNLCDNGGHSFWIDIEGYHKVSVDLECKDKDCVYHV
jgi:hypothetical protein